MTTGFPPPSGILKFAVLLLISSMVTRAAVTLNQHESFSGLHQWTTGDSNPNPPVVQGDSGPAGTGDHALRVTANGSAEAGGRLLVFNDSTWTGDYPGQGITHLQVDLRNGGSTALQMRLAFNGPGGWFVTPAKTVTAFSGWNPLLFDIRPGSLVGAGGSNANTTLSAVTELRVIHSSTVSFRGAAVSGTFLLDNVRAVPEPECLVLTSLAGCLLARRKRETTIR